VENLIIGGLIGFFAAIGKDLIVKWIDNKKEKKKFHREKIEEIFRLVDKASDELVRLPTRMADQNAKISYNFDDSNSRLAMLIQFYASNLEGSYHEYLMTYKDTHMYLIDMVSKKNDGNDFITIMPQYFEKYKALKKMIRNEAKKYL
jgi:hypothetical protein